jgi:predicted helicase
MKNFVFLEAPGKSFTKILQSIGRVMRKSKETGDNVFVYDLVDSFGYSTENYSLSHFWERLKYYESEEHSVIEKEISMK